MRKTFLLAGILFIQQSMAQQKMTPELLWQLGRVSGETVTDDGTVIFGVSRYNMQDNKSERNLWAVPVSGGAAKQLTTAAGGESVVQVSGGRILYSHKGQLWQMDADGANARQLTEVEGGLQNVRISPDGKHILFSKEVKLEKITGADRYPDLPKSNVQVYTSLNYRHWDAWEDGSFNHVFYATWDATTGKVGEPVDIMKDEKFDCPQMPFGGAEDLIWSPDGKQIIYVCKKKHGKDYAVSTNTDIYRYTLASGQTENLSEGMMGYDVSPAFGPDGKRMLWLSMARDGYEADKNDIIEYDLATGKRRNLTEKWDGTVAGACFSKNDGRIFFLAVVKGTEQLFEATGGNIRQLTKGLHDLNGFVGQHGNTMVVTRTDMNHAAELYTVDLKNGGVKQLTGVNNDIYSRLQQSKVEERWIKTTDGQQMLAWVIYPPDFDASKKYPTLLYCQGGPQSALSQF
ncbi:MAG: S9 family peptidase, partial [Chitinophaga sp.]